MLAARRLVWRERAGKPAFWRIPGRLLSMPAIGQRLVIASLFVTPVLEVAGLQRTCRMRLSCLSLNPPSSQARSWVLSGCSFSPGLSPTGLAGSLIFTPGAPMANPSCKRHWLVCWAQVSGLAGSVGMGGFFQLTHPLRLCVFSLCPVTRCAAPAEAPSRHGRQLIEFLPPSARMSWRGVPEQDVPDPFSRGWSHRCGPLDFHWSGAGTDSPLASWCHLA
jgi:hypothetical protein